MHPRPQHTSDYVPQLEAFVPLLCANAKPHATVQRLLSLPAAEGGSPTKGGPKQRRSASAGMAAEMEEAEAWNGLRASCLRALLEHLRFCARLSYVSYHLHTITFAVLECVEASGQGAPAGRYTSPRALLESAGGSAGRDAALASMQGLSRGSISHAVAASPPDVAALLVFEELAHMTRVGGWVAWCSGARGRAGGGVLQAAWRADDSLPAQLHCLCAQPNPANPPLLTRAPPVARTRPRAKRCWSL